jgi:hypothetical protein
MTNNVERPKRLYSKIISVLHGSYSLKDFFEQFENPVGQK